MNLENLGLCPCARAHALYDKVTGSYLQDAVGAVGGAYKDEGGLISSRCHGDRGQEDGLVQHDDGRVVVAGAHNK